MLKKGAIRVWMCEYKFKKSKFWGFFKKGGQKKESELILKHVIAEFEFALRV